MSVTTLDGQTLTKRQARRAQRQGQMIVVQAPQRPLWKRWWLSRLVGYGVVAVVAVVVLAWKSLFGAGRWRSLGWPVWVAGLAVAALGPTALRGIPEPVDLYAITSCPALPDRSVDPICQMAVGRSSAAATRTVNGVEHLFCSPECVRTFDRLPTGER